MLYDPVLVRPMREELTRLGFEELGSPDDVDRALGPDSGNVLLVVNSVCGCAARNARPAVAMATQHDQTPDGLVTVFAGQDTQATARAREFLTGYRPSSPSIALLQDGNLVFMLERHQIEGRSAFEISEDIKAAFDRYCGSPA